MVTGHFLERPVPRNGQFLERSLVSGQWRPSATFLNPRMVSGQFLERSVPRNRQFLEKVTGQWSVTTFLDLPRPSS